MRGGKPEYRETPEVADRIEARLAPFRLKLEKQQLETQKLEQQQQLKQQQQQLKQQQLEQEKNKKLLEDNQGMSIEAIQRGEEIMNHKVTEPKPKKEQQYNDDTQEPERPYYDTTGYNSNGFGIGPPQLSLMT